MQRGIDGFVWDTPYNVFTKDPQRAPVNALMKRLINNMKATLHDKELFVNMDRPNNNDIQLIRSLKFDGLLIQNYATMNDPD